MISNRIIRIVVYSILFVFVISRMLVSLREYQDVDYSPLSIIMTISLIMISLVLAGFQIKTLLFSGINRLILLLLMIGIVIRPAFFIFHAVSSSAPRTGRIISKPKGYRVKGPSVIGSMPYSSAEAK